VKESEVPGIKDALQRMSKRKMKDLKDVNPIRYKIEKGELVVTQDDKAITVPDLIDDMLKNMRDEDVRRNLFSWYGKKKESSIESLFNLMTGKGNPYNQYLPEAIKLLLNENWSPNAVKLEKALKDGNYL